VLRALTWVSEDPSRRLTAQEVNALFSFTYEVAQAGQLTEGKYIGATTALYWQRLKGTN
jgi:hypothetical protein